MSEIDDILDPVLENFQMGLTATLQGHSASVYLKGAAEMISWGRTKLRDRPIFYEGPPMQQAINYANKRAAQMVTHMDTETKGRLAHVIGNAIKNKRGIPGLARDIRREIGDMTKFRSELIAKTEIADSLESAFMDRSKAMGVTGKEWVTVGDDRVSNGCTENEAVGPIPLNQPFPSGDMRPPRFPGCRCTLAPVMLEGK